VGKPGESLSDFHRWLKEGGLCGTERRGPDCWPGESQTIVEKENPAIGEEPWFCPPLLSGMCFWGGGFWEKERLKKRNKRGKRERLSKSANVTRGAEQGGQTQRGKKTPQFSLSGKKNERGRKLPRRKQGLKRNSKNRDTKKTQKVLENHR